MQLIRPGMGTENSTQLIYSLIQMVRPRTVIEIGAGDSTRFIAKALQKAKQAWQQDTRLLESSLWEERTALLDPSGIPENYESRLIAIDDFTAEDQSDKKARGKICTKSKAFFGIFFARISGNQLESIQLPILIARFSIAMAYMHPAFDATDLCLVLAGRCITFPGVQVIRFSL